MTHVLQTGLFQDSTLGYHKTFDYVFVLHVRSGMFCCPITDYRSCRRIRMPQWESVCNCQGTENLRWS
ncbi:hypothetical protein R5R35_014576 [Gryllus longicercus]|uniref:Uncharacterized protein n=1 Tax=Gryllus longicercus TaxID=2509291 RepID=A0AAN9Z3R3_9ORTH